MTYQLRPDLSRIGLNQLVATAQASDADDTPAMNEVIRRFDPLARKLARGVETADYYLRDDLANAARLGVVTAVRRHNGGPGFPAYAKVYMRGAVLREFGRWIVPETLSVDVVDIEESDHDRRSEDTNDVLDRMAPWGDGKVAAAIVELDDSQLALVHQRYVHGAAIKEIAEVVGTSGPAVSQRLATIHRRVASALAA